MTMYEAQEKIDHLNNNIELKQKQISLLFSKTQPQATKFDSDRVSGGTRESKIQTYCEDTEQLQKELDSLLKERKIYQDYLESELKAIDKYNPQVKRIIEGRQKYHLTWSKTAKYAAFSRSQSIRYYNYFYKGRKNER